MLARDTRPVEHSLEPKLTLAHCSAATRGDIINGQRVPGDILSFPRGWLRKGGVGQRVNDLPAMSVWVMYTVGAVCAGHTNVGVGMAAGVRDMREAAGNARYARYVGRGHMH